MTFFLHSLEILSDHLKSDIYSFLTKIVQEIDYTSSFNISANCFLLIKLIYRRHVEIVRPLEHKVYGIVYNLRTFLWIISWRGRGTKWWGEKLLVHQSSYFSSSAKWTTHIRLLKYYRDCEKENLKYSKWSNIDGKTVGGICL